MAGLPLTSLLPCCCWSLLRCVVDVERSQILIFGGRSASETKLQDLYAWDVKRQSLKLLPGSSPEDSGPPGRCVRACRHSRGRMGLVGCERRRQTRAPRALSDPDAHLSCRVLLCREFHCACFYDGQMFIFGGSTGTRRMNDTWRYKLDLEPPSLQILAAHALLQQTDDPDEFAGKLPDELIECLKTLRPNSFKLTAGLMR